MRAHLLKYNRSYVYRFRYFPAETIKRIFIIIKQLDDISDYRIVKSITNMQVTDFFFNQVE